MRRLISFAIASSAALTLGGTVGCQMYDFQVVSQGTLSQTEESFPLTPPLKPNLWLLLDKSGSMNSSDCPGCPSRLASLKTAMDGFLQQHGDVARIALTTFPADAECAPAKDVLQPLPAETPNDVGTSDALKAQAQAVNDKVKAITAEGGTPTGASIVFVGSQPGLNKDDGRDDFILLLTDGLPNCNDKHLASLCDCAKSQCTSSPQLISQCRCTTSDRCFGSFCSKGCLDADGAAQHIAEQKVKGIRTLVLAFGPDVNTGDSAETLAAMATAGGGNFRTCKNDGECGSGDSCNVPAGGGTGLCKRQYYKASNAAELGNMLAQISASIRTDPCTFPLTQGQPDSEKTVSVLVNGQDVRPGPSSWAYSGNAIVFAHDGQYCKDIMAQTPGMTLRVRYVKTL